MKKLMFYFSFILATLLFVVWIPTNIVTALGQTLDNDNLIIKYSDNIKTDSILVTLSTEETRKFKTYTVKDFEEVNCISIENLTSSLESLVKSKIENNESNADNSLLNVDEFKTILKLNIEPQSKNKIFELVNQLNKRADIYSAAPNYIYTTGNDESLPNNDVTNEQWGLYGTNGIQVENAWNISTGSNMITVGIMDGGVQGDHEDLLLNVDKVNGQHLTYTNGISEIDPLDFISDYDGHGTHIAGIIGATNSNQLGTDGICKDVDLVSLRVFDWIGETATSWFALAISDAITMNIPILNYSAGGYIDDDLTFRNMLSTYTGLFICSAGNENSNNDTTKFYPSEYSYNQTFSDRIISVGAINEDEERSVFSNYGQNSVSIYAPGTDIISTFPLHLCESVCSRADSELTISQIAMKSAHVANGYHYMSGTSMAAPYVSGVAALLLSNNPGLTAAQLKNSIINGSDTIEISTPDGNQIVKKLNATKALTYAIDNYGRRTTLTYNDEHFCEEVYEDSGYVLKIDVKNAYNYSFCISSLSAVKVSLYDENLNEIVISITSSNNNRYLNFNKYLAEGKYYLSANFVSSGEFGDIDINISGQYHSHSYTYRYEPAGIGNHRAYCTCGGYQLKSHIVRVGINGPENTCALCGALALVKDINGLNSSARYVTVNGSFIASNGIICLVDEDFDAYFEGTLQFYLSTNPPVLTNSVAIYGEGMFPN